MKKLMFCFALVVLPTAISSAGELKGSFQDSNGKTIKTFVIEDLSTAKKPELEAILLKTCTPPLTYTKDGKFYCAKGTGPHEMRLSTPRERDLLVKKLAEAKLIKIQ